MEQIRNWRILGRPWQDLIFAIGEVGFLVSLIPIITSHVRLPLYTGLITGMMLYLYCLCHISYGNWITLALTFVAGTIWIFLGINPWSF